MGQALLLKRLPKNSAQIQSEQDLKGLSLTSLRSLSKSTYSYNQS